MQIDKDVIFTFIVVLLLIGVIVYFAMPDTFNHIDLASVFDIKTYPKK